MQAYFLLLISIQFWKNRSISLYNHRLHNNEKVLHVITAFRFLCSGLTFTYRFSFSFLETTPWKLGTSENKKFSRAFLVQGALRQGSWGQQARLLGVRPPGA